MSKRLSFALALLLVASLPLSTSAWAQVAPPAASPTVAPSGGGGQASQPAFSGSSPNSSPFQASGTGANAQQSSRGSTPGSSQGSPRSSSTPSGTGSQGSAANGGSGFPGSNNSSPAVDANGNPIIGPDGITTQDLTPSTNTVGGSSSPNGVASPAAAGGGKTGDKETKEKDEAPPPKKKKKATSPLTPNDSEDAAAKDSPPQAISPTDKPDALDSLLLAPAEPVALRATLHKKSTMMLSLADALQLSEGKNISLRIAKENQKIQQTDYLLRLSDLLPDITGTYLQSRLVGSVQVFGGETTEVTRNTFQPQVTANYTVYTGGRNIFDIQASKHRLEALKGQTESTRQDMLRQIAMAYYDMQSAYWQRSLAQQSLREAAQQVALNRGRFEEGIGLEVDALQAESNQSLRRQDLVQAEVAVSQASETLAQLLNLDFEVELLPDTLDAVMIRRVPETLSVKQLIEIANKRNPNLARLTELAKAGKSDVHTAVADLFPQINLSTYRNRTGANPTDALPTRFTGLQASWNIGENLGFARPLAIRQAKSNMLVAQANLQQGQRLLQQNVVNTAISLQALTQTVQAAWDNLRATQAGYAQASGRLQEGVGTNLELQLALTNLATARSNLATAFFNYNRLEVAQLYNLGVVSPDTVVRGFKP